MVFTEKKCSVSIPENEMVTVKETGDIIKITAAQRRVNRATTEKIDTNHYRVISSGKIKEYQHITNRSDAPNSIRKTMAVLRDIINTNVTDIDKCRWITLTYRANMQDSTKLRYDVGHFIAKTRKRYGSCEYIAVAEPQGRGAWHLHIILIFEKSAPFMKNEVVREELWNGKGFVKVSKLTDVDNVGAYLTAYLTDIPINEFKKLNPTANYVGEIKEAALTNGKSKRYVKGGRLALYPPKFHLFRLSKGIKRPITYRCSYSQIKSQLGDLSPTWSDMVDLFDPETNFQNRIVHEIYNTKRRSCI